MIAYLCLATQPVRLIDVWQTMTPDRTVDDPDTPEVDAGKG